MSAGLEVRGLVVAPGGADPVLDQVDLELEAGTRAALVGPSGAGKTTLLRAIAGLTSIRSGEIMVDGTDQAGIPAHDRRIAMVFQEPRLLPNLSALENVAMPMRAAGSGKQERQAVATERLTEVGLGGFGERRIGGLSGGEQQRVALARALCADPELLLLDEPLAALDPNRRESLRRLLVEVQEARGLTSLLVTHDRSEAAELGQSIALMLDGRIVGHDSPKAMFERPRSVAAARFFGIANILELDRDPSGARWSIRPERVVLGSGSSRARVVEAVYRGTEVRLVMEWAGQRVETAVAPDKAPAVGVEVAFELPSEHLWRLPDEGPGMEE